VAKRKTDLGTLSKGSPGQWSWIAHRVTGVAIILFLLAMVPITWIMGRDILNLALGWNL
jgi:succinate dehydrogenase/fumarate reductase cytochrome b subunit